jgi:hypothetical protein
MTFSLPTKVTAVATKTDKLIENNPTLKNAKDKLNAKIDEGKKKTSQKPAGPPPEPSKKVSSASLIKQIQCPTLAPQKLGTAESISFVFGTTIPETLGYISGYNFTGLGSNDPDPDDSYFSRWGQKAGVSGGYSKSKRVLGFNYFYPKNEKCSNTEGKCKGAQKYMYIRNYPIAKLKGNLSFAIVDDLLDLNPIGIILGLLGLGATEKCVQTTLPVGSHFMSSKKISPQYKNSDAFVSYYNQCTKNCDQLDEGVDNCNKACFRGWWEEAKCIAKPSTTRKVKYGGKTYHIPVSTSTKGDNFSDMYESNIEEKNIVFYNISVLIFLIIAIICSILILLK